MIEKLFLLKWLNKAPAWLGHLYSMFLVVIGWTIFAQTDIGQLGQYLKAMFGVGAAGGVDSDFLYFLSCNAVLLVLLVLCSIDHRHWLGKLMRRDLLQKNASGGIYTLGTDSRAWTVAKAVLMVVLLLVSFAFLVGDSYNPFLYFRF
jgi:alginate O-acetyltransferase complex protein AlgI